MCYKYCIVPQCTSTSVKTPEKRFLSVPKNSARRKKWLLIIRKNPMDLVASSSHYICEDHFNMETDVKNYMAYKMGFASKLCLKEGVMPSKFDCQPDRKRRLPVSGFHRLGYIKRRRIEFLREILTEAVDEKEPEIALKEDNVSDTFVRMNEFELGGFDSVGEGIVKMEEREERLGEEVKEEHEYSQGLSHIKTEEELDLDPGEGKTEDKDALDTAGLDSVGGVVKMEEREEILGGEVKEEHEESQDLPHIKFEEELEAGEGKTEDKDVLDTAGLDSVGEVVKMEEREEILGEEVKEEHEDSQDYSRETVDPLAYPADSYFSCHYCDFRTPAANVLNEHIQNRRMDQCPISCSQCTFSCSEQISLTEHLRSWHGEDRPSSSAYWSPTSDFKVINHSIRARRSTGRPYPCPHCDYTSVNFLNLEKHIQARHSNDRSHSCPQSDLKQHMKVLHNRKRPFSCQQCNYTCVRSSHLKDHMRARHSNDRPHSCPYCDFSYARLCDMKSHIRARHSNDHSHSCPHCHITCSKSSNLKRHIKGCHSNDRPHSCPHCDFTCVQSGDLKRHIQALHSNDRPHSCPHCDYSSVQSCSLKRHIQEFHTNDRPHSCPYCEYSCARSSYLKSHIQVRHLKSKKSKRAISQ